MDKFGMAVAARMEFVSDVADQDGSWRRSGMLTITDGRCLAMDPFCGITPGSMEMYRFEFPMRSGRYEAQTYNCSEEALGLRIVPRFPGSAARVDDLSVTREAWMAGEPRESFDQANDRLDALLEQHELKDWVAAFFDWNGKFEGQLLTTISDDQPHEITVADLYSITLLGVHVGPHGVRLLLEDEATRARVAKLLDLIPVDEDIWTGKSDLGPGSPADRLYDLLKMLDCVDDVTASKLLHRKRPRLIPIVDRVVREQVAAPSGSYWEFFREYLGDPTRRQAVNDLRPKGIERNISVLRVLDVAICMTGSASMEARKVRAGT